MKAVYNIYPSLLDSFQSYLDSSEIYQQYYGFSEEPAVSEQEFEINMFNDLINKINRVPFESEAANTGTCFNLLVDYYVIGYLSKELSCLSNNGMIVSAMYKGVKYGFNYSLIEPLKAIYHNAVAQVRLDGEIETLRGKVNLYGYSDYVTPFAIHDLKTTNKYKAGKFYKSWQRIVYPYCAKQMGYDFGVFQFDVIQWSKDGGTYFSEYYRYIDEADTLRLKNICEDFIQFLEYNRNLITDKKIFNI